MNRVEHQIGFILKSQSFKENSLIHQVFTRDFGLVSILSKGSKATVSKYGSLLQPFRSLTLSWVGKSDLKTLTSVDERVILPSLKGRSLYCGFYMNELILNFFHKHDAHPRLFDIFNTSLTALSNTENIEAVLRQFEKTLLNEIGYGLSLEYEADNQLPIEPDQYYFYQPGYGAKRENNAQHPDAMLGSTLIHLNNNTLEDKTELKQAKRLMRRLIDHQLDGKILKSRDLFN